MSEKEIKHHRLSMSQWTALAVCPHFQPSKKPSPEADEGTAAHKEAADIYMKIRDGEAGDAYAHEGKYPQAAWCAAAYKNLQDMKDLPSVPDGATAACAVEMKLSIQQTDPLIDGIYGYADFVRLLRGADGNILNVTVADFKTFSDGTRNFDEQLAGYAVAVASTIPDAVDEIPVKLITIHGLARRLTESNTTLGQCRRVAVDTVMKYLCRDRFPKVLNDKCRYCANYPCEGAVKMLKAVQPELAGLQLDAASMDADPESIPLTLAALEDVQKLIDATRATATECIKKHGTKGVTKDGLDCWTVGGDDCRYEVRQSLGSRKIPDVPRAVNAIIDDSDRKIAVIDLLGICSMPVGKAETLVRKSLGLKPKDAGERLARLGIIERGPNTESLKRIA